MPKKLKIFSLKIHKGAGIFLNPQNPLNLKFLLNLTSIPSFYSTVRAPNRLLHVESQLILRSKKKSLLIVKLRSFQNASIEIKQISFACQQNCFTVKKTHLKKAKRKYFDR